MGSFLQALTGLALLVVTSLPALAEAPYSASFGRGVLHVGDSAAPHVFQIEIAETAASRAQGLMYREEMAEDAGMLFIYPSARIASFWMKNTLIPLDMLFIKVSGEIVQIARDAVPGSLASIRSNAPVRAVLELNAGVADRLGIRVGDMVRLFRQPTPAVE